MCTPVRRILLFVLCLLSFLFQGCGGSSGVVNELELTVSDFYLLYDGKALLQKVYLNNTDSEDILQLYQETGSNIGYKDSLLVAEKYNQGLGVNSFVQQNLDTLEVQGLSLDNIDKTQILINKKGKQINGVLVEYEINKGFVSSVPVLYMSQLFIPSGDSIILFSYMTENSSNRSYMSSVFKKIK